MKYKTNRETKSNNKKKEYKDNNYMNNNIFFFLNLFLQIIILFLLDIWTKYFFTNKFFFLDNLFSIKYTRNVGSSFGMFSNIYYYNALIIFLSFVILLVLFLSFIYVLNHNNLLSSFKERNNRLVFYSVIFGVAGILGNLYDRLFFGFVRDFLSIKYLFVFNFADFYMSFALFLLILNEFWFKNKKEKRILIKN